MRLGNPLFLVLAVNLFTVPIQGLLHDLHIADFVFEAQRGDAEYQALALELVAAGSLAFLIGFRYLFNSVTSSRPTRAELVPERPGVYLRGAYLLLGGWAFADAALIVMYGAIGTVYLPISAAERYDSSLIMILQLATETGFVGLLWVAIRCNVKSSVPLSLKMLIAVAIGLHLLVIMGAGAKWHIVRLALALLIIGEQSRWLDGKPMKSLRNYAIFAVVIIVSFRIIVPYREIARANPTWMTGSYSLSENVGTQVRYFIQAAQMAVRRELPPNSVESAGGRLSSLSSLMRVLSYLQGQPTYENLADTPLVPFYAVLPRTFFPNKAIFINGGEFGHLNGLKFTAFSLTLPGSLFWIGGWPGVCIGFALLGAIMGWYWAKSLMHRDDTHVAFAMCLLANLTLWDADGPDLLIQLIRWRLTIAVVLLAAALLGGAQRQRKKLNAQRYPGTVLASSR
jgi:hypothetical protein